MELPVFLSSGSVLLFPGLHEEEEGPFWFGSECAARLIFVLPDTPKDYELAPGAVGTWMGPLILQWLTK